MPVIDRLASVLGRKDEVPNLELAQDIAARKDKKALEELAGLLRHKNKAIRSDSIKVLYEVGGISPELVSGFLPLFTGLLCDRNNRLQWGAMTAISTITPLAPEAVFAILPQILAAADKGSVITKDQGIRVLVQLAGLKAYTAQVIPLLLEQLQQSLPNQLPLYAEQALLVVPPGDKNVFIRVLQHRLGDMEQESKRKRLEKVIGKLQKL